MDYSKYQKSRDLSWQILLDFRIGKLPVKVSEICKSYGIRVVRYSTADQLFRQFHLTDRADTNDGFTFDNVIFYNDSQPMERQRFTVAHELGHILLHNGNGMYNREPSVNDNPIEQEANVFASRLLAPACVLWGLGVTTAQQISNLCNISMQSAEFRMERMKLLYARESEHLEKYGRSCFLLSQKEQAVYNQFLSYIKENKL